MTNYQRARKKVIKIEQKADSFLDKVKESPITAVFLAVVAVLSIAGLISLVL